MPLLKNIRKMKKKAVDLYDTGEALGKKYFGRNPRYKGPRGTYEDLYGPTPIHVKKGRKRPVVRQARPLTTKPVYAADRPLPKANRIKERLNRKK